MENPENRQLTKDEVNLALQDEILNSLQELNNLHTEIGHSEAKRLHIACSQYPLADADFSDESDAMKLAFGACKRMTDAKIALAVEVTLQSMIEREMGQRVETEEKVDA